MKGKIILLFVLALVALVLIGMIGQSSLRDMIISIEEASTPNQKVAVLHDILQDLSDAENSVRTFTITRDGNQLYNIATNQRNIDGEIQHLRELTTNVDQSARIDTLRSLVSAKFSTLQRLINIRKVEQDNEVLRKIREDIRQLKKQQPTQSEESNGNDNIFKRLFGSESTEKKDSLSASGQGDSLISSAQLGKAIERIDEENAQNEFYMKEQELALTRTDNRIMQRIRKEMQNFEDQEILQTKTRAARSKEATQKTINVITTTLVVTLIIFAVLLLVIFNDISRNQRNRLRLRHAKEKAERLAKVKEEFLSNMSHEIRTPLNSILGFADQLVNTPLDQEQQSHLKKIRHSGAHLLRLINDILDYAKMESNKLELEYRAFDPQAELYEIAEIFYSQATEKGLGLTVEKNKDVPAVLMGDLVRFRQILINLISNAIKFTHKGSITVTLEGNPLPENQFELHLLVVDSGIGIDDEHLEHIFDEFSQADSSTARKYGGTGLGLSIVNKIAKLHNGSVSVRNNADQGTTFEVLLMYDVGSKELLERQEIQPINGEVHFTDVRALVIDDQEFNLELIDIIFRKWDIQADLFSQGDTGLEAFSANHYDIIFLDLHMPEINGIEVARKIRETDQQIPIIALTAGTSQDDLQQSTEAGMNDHLIKPYTKDHLLQILEKYFSPRQEMIAATHNTDERPQVPPDNLDLSELEKLGDGDQRFIRNMMEIFVSNFAMDLQVLREAVASKKLQDISGRAHKMAPPCRHLGFTYLASQLKDLENKTRAGVYTDSIEEWFLRIENEFNRIEPLINSEIKSLDQKIHIS